MPPNPYWNCKIANTVLFTSILWGCLLILNMTFERFYSIIRPHKAASFNMVKRAKMNIACVFIFGILYNIPHLFLTIDHGTRCIPCAAPVPYVGIYYWFSFFSSICTPFCFIVSNEQCYHTHFTKKIIQGILQGHKIKVKVNIQDQVQK